MTLNVTTFAILLILADLTLLFLPRSFLLPWSVALLMACLLLLLAFFHRRKYWLYAAVWLAGMGYTHHHALMLMQQAESVRPQKISLTFTIDEIINQQDYQTLIARAILQENSVEQKIFLNWKADAQPKLGEVWQADVALRPLSARLNFGGFDRQQWYLAKGITATGSVKSAVKIGEISTWRTTKLQQVREQTQGLSQQGLLIALAFGERAWLDKDTWLIYQQTNTAHLIAISGLHIGLAMGIGFLLARVVQFAFPTRWIQPVFPLFTGVVVALFYAYLAGFSVPTFRAISAVIFVTFVQYSRRYFSPFQLFLIVVAFLLCWDPLMPLSMSFWLSVGAVGCLIIWYQRVPFSLFQWRYQPFSPKVRWILSLFHLQFGLLLLFTPLQLFLFNGIAANGFFANLLAVPLYSFFLVPLILFALFTQGALYSWLLANALAEGITQLIALFQGSWISISLNSALILTALCSLIFLLIIYAIYHERSIDEKGLMKPARFFTLNLIKPLSSVQYQSTLALFAGGMLCCFLVFAIRYFTKPNWQLDTLDVGQGLATLIVKNNKGILYDTGPAWQGGSMAELEILPYLQREGIELERLILSHDDNDHSGGAPAILKVYPDVELMSSSEKPYGEKRRLPCVVGKTWQWQGIYFRVLSPEQLIARADNPHSCVILVDNGKYRVLLTGDAETKNEQNFARTLGKIDVLQVGHHGSKTSTGEFLLSQTKPDIAVISSGRWNPWRFPNSSVTERLTRHQSAVENTAVSGQIRVLFFEKTKEIQRARHEFSPWYAHPIGLSSE